MLYLLQGQEFLSRVLLLPKFREVNLIVSRFGLLRSRLRCHGVRSIQIGV